MITLIVAMATNRVIGRNGMMPWHLPRDLRHFKANTVGKTIIMGRKTFESIGSKPLPNRYNIVISRTLSLEGVPEVYPSLEEALDKHKEVPELVVIGGGELYRQMLPRADRLLLTIVDANLPGDTYFPEWIAEDWVEVDREHHPVDEKHKYAFDFVKLVRSK